MIISLTGDLGSGKTSIASVLKEKYNYNIVTVGSIFRDIAKQRGVSVIELNKIAETDLTIDTYVDTKQAELNNSTDNVILDSRLGWHFVPNSFKVYVTVDIAEAAKRICNDKKRVAEQNSCEQDTIKAIITRQQLERNRYGEKYGVNLLDYNNYDLIIESTYAKSENVADEIMRILQQYVRGQKYLCLAPKSLYPTQCTRDLNADTLNMYVQKYKTVANKYITDNIIVTKQNSFWSIVDGHHRVLASIKTNKDFIYASYADYTCALTLSNIYDFEGIGGFRYLRYPEM